MKFGIGGTNSKHPLPSGQQKVPWALTKSEIGRLVVPGCAYRAAAGSMDPRTTISITTALQSLRSAKTCLFIRTSFCPLAALVEAIATFGRVRAGSVASVAVNPRLRLHSPSDSEGQTKRKTGA